MPSHYVPGKNAQIDTREFESELEQLADGGTGRELDDMEFEEKVYDAVERRLSRPPKSVSPETVVCRYLNTQKFLWFLSSKSIFFGRIDGFDDSWDCAIPADYADAVAKFYSSKGCPPLMWDHYAEAMRSRWLMSCWTEVSSNVDDYLLWYRYAGGPLGVGITIQYDPLREELEQGLSEQADEASHSCNVLSGYVDYGEQHRVLPFNKRRMFRNECEIRFVAQSDLLHSLQVPVHRIFDRFGLRFSPDTPPHHRTAIEEVWLKYGGSDAFVTAED